MSSPVVLSHIVLHDNPIIATPFCEVRKLIVALPFRISHRVGMENDAKALIDRLGGTTAVAKATGWPISTIHSWRSSKIPDWRMPVLMEIARDQGVSL